MGGFEGGDEAGFWDAEDPRRVIEQEKINQYKPPCIETNDFGFSIKAYAKVNIFFKITGYENGVPTFISRFVRVNTLYDTISFIPCQCDTFTIEGCENISLESNSIYKAYKAICDYTNDSDIEDFFMNIKLSLLNASL